jgi:hypothetical protein|tara:strand:+ start:317 stop:439 length:123 start_codon:yes stop_codon:yes gene_type:complete
LIDRPARQGTRADLTINNMVRKQTLDWAELFWKNCQPERE